MFEALNISDSFGFYGQKGTNSQGDWDLDFGAKLEGSKMTSEFGPQNKGTFP